MIILSILMILLAVIFLGFAILRVRSIMAYNRRLRMQSRQTRVRRRSRPKRLDPATLMLFPLSLALLLAAMMILPKNSKPDPVVPENPDPTTGAVVEEQAPDAVGWKKTDGKQYYLDKDGNNVTGWLDLSGKRYYFQADGAMSLGWQTVDGSEYYFQEDGSMARGQVEIDGVNHFFTSTGAEVVVVNPWNSVPEDYESTLISLSGDYAVEDSQVDQSCLNDLISMLDACNAEAPRAYVVSAYRSYSHQSRNFQRKVNEYLNKGYSQADAEKEAATVVAVPGTSEHQLGLAVDIIDTQLWDLVEEQENLPAQKWLMANSWRYGFIFRYPKDKIDVTGIIYEPWHYRYVGKELAREIHESGLTLEEYMASLS